VPKPLPKPIPKPSGPAPLDDEDAVFLSAMGLKPSAPRAPKPTPTPAGAEVMPPSEPRKATESFLDAVKDLKGLKPLMKGLPEAAPLHPAKVEPPKPGGLPSQAPAPVPPPEPVAQEPATPEGVASNQPNTPFKFQLAAGMAIEVDGSIDLRGHSLADAMERLKDRLGDGLVLGWRSLQVMLGPDPALHEGLLALLTSGEIPMVARYAQAPVPMGGTQAWLLYFGMPSAQS